MSFFDRLSNGWSLAMNSFKVLRENKQLIIFPILSGICILAVIASFFAISWNAGAWDDESGFESLNTPLTWVLTFGFYLVNYFVVVFFNTALIHCTRLYFHGEEVTVRAGMQFAFSRIGVIFSWAFFAATVGMILKTIQENSGWLGKIITGILGVVWSVATFFVVPVIAYEKAGPLEAFRRSSGLMKQKWGESLGATFSFGLIQFIGFMVVGGVLFLLGSLVNTYVGIGLAVLGMFLVFAIMSAAETIFVSAVYHNITGDPVRHFNEQMVDRLFEHKSSKW